MTSTPVDALAQARALFGAGEDAEAAVRLGTKLATELRNTHPHDARKAAEVALGALQHLERARWDRFAVECLYAVGDLRYRTGDLTDATGILLEAIELCVAGDPPVDVDPILLHRLHARLSVVYAGLGLYAYALSECRRALALATQVDDPTSLCWTYADMAMIHLHLGEPREAAHATDRAIAAGGRPGADPARLGIAHINAILAFGRQELVREARAHADAAERLRGSLPPAERAGLRIATGELHMRLGDVDRAEADFVAALAEVARSGERLQIFGALTGEASVRLLRGDPAGARDIAARALGLGDASVSLTLVCERVMARALEALGDLAGALEWEKRSHASDRRNLRSHGDERLRVLELEHRADLAEQQSLADRIRAEQAEEERRLSAERYEAMIEGSADIVALFESDSTLRWVGASAGHVLGIPSAELVGQRPIELFEHEDPSVPIAAVRQAMALPGIPSVPVEYRVRHRDGLWRWFSAVITDLRNDPSVNGLMFVATDTTAHRWNEAIATAQAAVLDLITRNEPLAEVLDRVVQSIHHLCSPAVRCHTRWDDAPVDTDTSTGSAGAADLTGRTRFEHPLADSSGRPVAHLIVDVLDGHETTADEARVLDQSIQLARIGVERSTTAASMEHQATHDHLTGLPNRFHFEQLATQAIANRAETDPPLALLFLDLDRFKLVNDSLGHGVGDRLLVQVTERIRGCLADGQLAARFGGDEFTVLCPQVIDAASVDDLAERLTDSIRLPFVVDDLELCLSASIGITLCRHRETDASQLISEADSAMFRAKEQGRDRAELFDDGMRVAVDARLHRGNALRHAVPRDELRLVFQPIVALDTGRVCGHEALVRWHSAELGAVMPEDFIPLAEETGLIVPIGGWVIRNAMEALASQAVALPVWINLSVNQIGHPSLLDTVRSGIAEFGIDPADLCFEITETAVGRDLDATIDRIAALRDLGTRIAIDDFGTGYSSLDRLQSLPVQVLKIDRSFVSGVDRSPRRGSLLDAILELSDSLGMESLAEGVETGGELARLADSGCTMAQGFLFARPEPDLLADRVLDLAALKQE